MIPYKSIHFIGILTAEMADIAVFCRRLGLTVSGSDDHSDTLYTPILEAAGVTVHDMFAQANITKSLDVVVTSPFYDTKHTEAETAAKHKIPVVTATDLQKQIAETFNRCLVLDNYVGPMITSWLDHVWNQGYLPLRSLAKVFPVTAGRLSEPLPDSDWLALTLTGFKRDAVTYEADFLSYQPNTVIVPSIRYDYPELNTTLDDVYQSYYTLVRRVPRKGLIIGNSDYPRMKRLRSHLVDRHIETYGFDRDAMWHIREVIVTDNKTSFYLAHDRQLLGPFTIPAVGMTAVYAAAAVAVASLLQDMSPATLGQGLGSVPPLKRFLESTIDAEGRLIIDDQADHPETITTALETIRQTYPTKKIWCLYQPGSFLRTKALMSELKDSLKSADFVYLADIKGYPKEKSEGLHVRHLIADVKHQQPQTYYFDSVKDMTGLLRDRVAINDCIVTLGVDGVCQEAVAPLLHPLT